MKKFNFLFITLISLTINTLSCTKSQINVRETTLFTNNWKFHMGDVVNGEDVGLDDSAWRSLDLPHDWSIEGEFSDQHPAGAGGGALPGGIGWYRKTFSLSKADQDKMTFIDFDGIYKNSEVWINGYYLGKRPYGYSSFRYDLTPYLHVGSSPNILAVRVDNSLQPNSRWYSGSGIYCNVYLVTVSKIHVDHWGRYIKTPDVTPASAQVVIETKVRNATDRDETVKLVTDVFDWSGVKVASSESDIGTPGDSVVKVVQNISISNPELWTLENPNLYRAISTIKYEGVILDNYETIFGVRTFEFDAENGFSLNDESVKINGVCNHHDLGCLGAAVNRRAIERQLEMLKDMGCNGIRTSHNPPAPELLDLCDRMGFIVMDEAFDIWKHKKSEYDYAMDWDEWYQQDLEAMILRDRNHPSVFIWSIGNEVMEQWEDQAPGGELMARELAEIVRNLDTTRPVTAACNGPVPTNPVIRSGALDLIGYNYHHKNYPDFPTIFPNQKFIASETVSSLATRGHYDMPSDSIRRWPIRWDIPFDSGNPDHTCSAYDNCSTPWGSTHEETWKIMKKYDFLSGMYIWTGFDYLGEPTPYGWPSRSSYFGIIDLAGFPKDAFYMYQSEWTNEPVLHIFPHWNWQEGDSIDIWAYTNIEEVELFLNDISMGTRKKHGDELHLTWRLAYAPGTLITIGRNDGREILSREIKTAGEAYQITLHADREIIAADGRDLSFITVEVMDKNRQLVPRADNLIQFEIQGEGIIAGVDNGCQTSHEPFKAHYRMAFHGKCLVVIQSTRKAGSITLMASSDGLESARISVKSK